MRINVGILPCRSSSVCIFTAALCLRNLRPRKQRQAEIDGGRVQSVQTLVQIHADRIVGVERPRYPDENLREVRIDAPVAPLVGVGQRRARHFAAEPHVVEFAAH